jgi:hypothetical protein
MRKRSTIATPGARGGGVSPQQTGSTSKVSAASPASISGTSSNINMQYTSGMGLRGGSLLGGWRGQILKGWTCLQPDQRGSGLPLSPGLYRRRARHRRHLVPLRPDYTGADLYDAPNGLFLNPAAYAVPVGPLRKRRAQHHHWTLRSSRSTDRQHVASAPAIASAWI